MVSFSELYEQLVVGAREQSLLQSAAAVLEWDQQTGLPSAAGEFRAEQLGMLARLHHQRKTSSEWGELLQALREHPDYAEQNGRVQGNVRELSRDYDRSVRVPEQLIAALANACSVGQQVWVEARAADNYRKFQPRLEEILRLKREQAAAINAHADPYDVLLDEYEPGLTTAAVTQVLDDLCARLVPWIKQIASAGSPLDDSVIRRDFPVATQAVWVRSVAEKIGFDFQRGRLDVTAHPFCTTLGPNDCRLTTRYQPRHFNSGFFGVLHEAGHGLYEQGLAVEDFGLPSGRFCSLGVHESQSRFWENQIGRSAEFWGTFFPQTQAIFPEALAGVEVSEFVRAVNRVEPSLIRVEADEMTYNLHIAIRFELESQLIRRQLSTDDLPQAWNDRYAAYLGIRPSSDREGVLQDVHWSAGLIGYFPTYTLGNLFAAELASALDRDLLQATGRGMSSHVADAEYGPILAWLRERVHAPGQTWPGPELIRRATGREWGAQAWLDYLRGKFSPWYQLC